MEITAFSKNIEFGNINSKTKLLDIDKITTSKEPIYIANVNYLPIKVFIGYKEYRYDGRTE